MTTVQAKRAADSEKAIVGDASDQNDDSGARDPFLQKAPSIEELRQMRTNLFSWEERARALSIAAEAVKVYSEEMISRWNAEPDTYLVYAGLFSAVLTAFNVQSYQLLQSDPQDATLAVLRQISVQISSYSFNPSFINSTSPAFQPTRNPPPRSAIWLNALWFSSLIISLTSASVCILVKQWLNEFVSGMSSARTREAVRLRQYRLNNLINWRVGDIVTAIPVLLQVALALFLAGLLVLLWTLHSTVATIATALVSVIAAFTVATTLLPLLNDSCAYLSPQSLAVYAIFQWIRYMSQNLRYHLLRPLLSLLVKRVYELANDPSHPHTRARRFLDPLTRALHICVGDGPSFQTWHGRERGRTIYNPGTTQRLDSDVLVMAYVTMDPSKLSTIAIGMADFDDATVVECFKDLHGVHSAHFGGNINHHEVKLWITCMICMLAVPADARDSRWARAVDDLAFYLPSCDHGEVLPSIYMDDPEQAEWIVTTISAIAWHLESPLSLETLSLPSSICYGRS